jgi:hypothetical protein
MLRRELRGESLVATTNALSAFVVDRCAGAGKPTIAAEGAAIVATHAMRFSPKLTHYFLELSDEVPSLHSVTTSSSTFRTYGISPDSRSVSRALRLLTNPSFDIPWVSPGIHSGNPDSNSPSCQWVNFMVHAEILSSIVWATHTTGAVPRHKTAALRLSVNEATTTQPGHFD